MILKTLKTAGIALLFFIVFVALTFPYSRLTPKLRTMIESGLRSSLGESATCTIDGFDISYTLGFEWTYFGCRNAWDQPLIEITDGRLSLFPGRQSLQGKMGTGSVNLKANAGLRSLPTRISGKLDKLPLEKIAPLLFALANSQNPNVPKELKLEGQINGDFDIPLKNLQKENGKVDLQIQAMKIPQQSLLERFGFSEVALNKSNVKAELKGGKLALTDIAFLSNQLSGKVEGNLEFQQDPTKSSGSMMLKWKIQKSDALLSSPLGMLIANAPCPSPDSDGFCTRKVTRLSELF